MCPKDGRKIFDLDFGITHVALDVPLSTLGDNTMLLRTHITRFPAMLKHPLARVGMFASGL
jgi:hypothetical protein